MNKYRKDIDGLRAVAILAVLAFHFFPSIAPGGFWGVDIFFVVSGYLISGIIFRKISEESFSFSEFYARRIRRIFPALILVLVSCLIAGWFLLFATEYAPLANNVAWGAGFMANIRYWRDANSYFDAASELKPLLHLWSLGIEEQFYIIWPVLLVFASKKKKLVFPLLAGLFSIAFLLNFLPMLSKTDLFFLPLSRFSELAAGSMLAWLAIQESATEDRNKSFLGKAFRYRDFLAISGSGLLIASLFIGIDNWVWRGGMIIPVLGTSLLIAAGEQAWINKNILSARTLVAIGLISYPLYLWHWPLLSFARIMIGDIPSVSLRIVLLATSFILAWMTYRFIESPIRRDRRPFTAIILFAAMIIVGACGLWISIQEGVSWRMPAAEKILATRKQGDMTDDACEKEFGSRLDLKFCRISGSGKKKIYILGDSLTRAVFSGYSSSLANEGYTVIQLSNSACPFPRLMNIRQQVLRFSNYNDVSSCDEKFNATLSTALADGDTAGILLANNAFNPGNGKGLERSMNQVLGKIPKWIKVAWFLQNPHSPFELSSCIDRPLVPKNTSENPDGTCGFPRKVSDDFQAGYMDAVAAISKKNPDTTIINPVDALCGKDACTVYKDGVFLYGDGQHLSISGSEYLKRKLPIADLFR